ncbi:MAG TPA: glycosyltransferase family A protein [Pyrinomonadaceae bacterium]|nr:glycosyltransferase family A protein [Pyrinomonadaceae bacterium]
MLLSIIICTRNRALEIADCLPEVGRQAKEFPDAEVIVVDNGSTDNTKEIVENFSKEVSYSFRYVFEPVAGLCQARNRGRAEARGKVLAYIDDDVRLQPEWIARVRESFLENKSDCLTGPVDVLIEGKSDFEFPDEMLGFFGKRNLGDQIKELIFPDFPIGCNMAFTTEVFDSVGGFDTNLKLYGDETDFFNRLSRKKSFKTLYDPKMAISQSIPANRITREELGHKSYLWGKGSATVWLLSSRGRRQRFVRILEFLLRTIYIQIRTFFSADFGQFHTLWYNRGYLAQLFKGLENPRKNNI